MGSLSKILNTLIMWQRKKRQGKFSHSVMSDSATTRTRAHQASLSIPTSGAWSNSRRLGWWCHQTTSSSVVPFSSHLKSFPASGSSPMSQFFALGGKVLEFQTQHQSFQWIFITDFLQDWLVGSPCSPRDSQESSPTPQFKSINFLLLRFLYGPTLTSIHDY